MGKDPGSERDVTGGEARVCGRGYTGDALLEMRKDPSFDRKIVGISHICFTKRFSIEILKVRG